MTDPVCIQRDILCARFDLRYHIAVNIGPPHEDVLIHILRISNWCPIRNFALDRFLWCKRTIEGYCILLIIANIARHISAHRANTIYIIMPCCRDHCLFQRDLRSALFVTEVLITRLAVPVGNVAVLGTSGGFVGSCFHRVLVPIRIRWIRVKRIRSIPTCDMAADVEQVQNIYNSVFVHVCCQRICIEVIIATGQMAP